jgi:hypothetical protein
LFPYVVIADCSIKFPEYGFYSAAEIAIIKLVYPAVVFTESILSLDFFAGDTPR